MDLVELLADLFAIRGVDQHPLRCRVGTEDYSSAPLTEPDLWAHIRLLKLISLEQQKLSSDL